MLAASALILLSCLLSLVYYIIQRKYSYWKKRGIPYLKPAPIVGNYGRHIFLQEQIAEASRRICNELEDEPLVGAYLGTEPILLVQDPEMVKTVLTKEFYFFSAREHSDYIHKEPLFRNLFNNYGDEWKVLRQNLTPLFSSAKMKNMFYLIESCARQFEKLLADEAKSGMSVNMRTLVSRYTLDCICSCAFGINSDSMGKDIADNPFRNIAESIFEVSYARGFKFITRSIWPRIFYAFKQRIFEPSVAVFFNDVLKEVFDERHYKPSSRNDLVDAMLGLYNNSVITGDSIECMNGDSGKVKLTVDQEMLISQCFVFFAAGFDTTSTTISFMLYELAKSPELQDRAIQEVDKYLSSKENKFEYSLVNSLPFLETCIDETLRLYPVLGFLPRQVYREYRLPNGSTLEAGLRVHVSVLKMHRSPKYFPDPEKFDPDRFSPERKHEIKQYSYLPFGEGPRICIGMRFAKMVMLTSLVTIFGKYRVVATKDTPATVTFDPKWPSTYPREEFALRLEPRT